MALMADIQEKMDCLCIRFEIYYVVKKIRHKNENETKHIGTYTTYFDLDGVFVNDELEIWFGSASS
jgi:hypothetical protein